MPPKKKQAKKQKAAPAKKKVEAKAEESEESESDDSDAGWSDEEDEEDLDGSDGDEEEIMVDFEFQDPKESDFLGLKALLGNYLDGELFSSSELCDAIIKQSTVGTCLKTQGAGDESDPVAVMSVMNLQTRKDAAPIKEICAHLKNKCPKDLQDKLASALSENGVGLIINERVINVPQETASPLVEGLFDEIEWAQEDEPTEELRASFKFKKYIVFSRVYMDDEAEDEGGKKRKRAGEVALVYPRPEDEFFHAESEWSFQWKSRTAEDQDAVDYLTPMRLCMLVDAGSVKKVRTAVKALFP
mmetsp:Transcript_9680/g.35215  ORF Transcript_9680/g.35215 Transcript_9680/m.35215 type:complete len:301 (-) Transcript_9680:97-999(-)